VAILVPASHFSFLLLGVFINRRSQSSPSRPCCMRLNDMKHKINFLLKGKISLYRRRPVFSPSMQPLVFWPLLAPRRRQCFSPCALLFFVCVYEKRKKKKKKNINGAKGNRTRVHPRGEKVASFELASNFSYFFWLGLHIGVRPSGASQPHCKPT